MTVASPFEHVVREDEDEDTTQLSHFMYHNVIGDHNHGEGVVINPRSLLRMMVERNKDGWSELRFELKDQSTRRMVMGDRSFGFSKCVEHRKAHMHHKGIRCFKIFVHYQSYAELELLISHWSMEALLLHPGESLTQGWRMS